MGIMPFFAFHSYELAPSPFSPSNSAMSLAFSGASSFFVSFEGLAGLVWSTLTASLLVKSTASIFGGGGGSARANAGVAASTMRRVGRVTARVRRVMRRLRFRVGDRSRDRD